MALDPTLMNITEKPLLAGDYIKQQQDFADNKIKNEANNLDIQKKKVNVGLQLLGLAADQASYDSLKPKVAQYFGPDIANSLPPKYDPATIQKYRMSLMDLDDQLNYQLKKEAFGIKAQTASLSDPFAGADMSFLGNDSSPLTNDAIPAVPTSLPAPPQTQSAMPLVPDDIMAAVNNTPAGKNVQGLDPVVANAAAVAEQNKKLGGEPNPYQKPQNGDAKYAGIPSTVLDSAKAVAGGDIRLSVAVTRMNPQAKQKFIALVKDMNPKFSEVDFEANKKWKIDKLGNQVRSFNVLKNHLSTLGGLADALGNGDVQKINAAANLVAKETGQPNVTNFNAAKRIVADEIAKAIIGGATALGDRESAESAINAAGSPAQLKGIIETYQNLADGQLDGLRTQYMVSTNNSEDDWNELLGKKKGSQQSHSTEQPTIKTDYKSKYGLE